MKGNKMLGSGRVLLTMWSLIALLLIAVVAQHPTGGLHAAIDWTLLLLALLQIGLIASHCRRVVLYVSSTSDLAAAIAAVNARPGRFTLVLAPGEYRSSSLATVTAARVNFRVRDGVNHHS